MNWAESGVFDIYLLNAFRAVAENGSFTAAAETLGVSQPRISLLVRRLEDQLGFALFVRTTRRTRPTPEGVEFLACARRILDALENAESTARKLRQISRGRLRIGAPQFSADVPARISIISEYIVADREAPIHISHGSLEEHLAALRTGEFDLIFATSPFDQSDDLEVLKVARARLCVGMPPTHELAGLQTVPLARLSGRRVVVVPRPPGDRLFDAWFGAVADAGADFVEAPEPLVPTVLQFGKLNNLPVLLYRWPGMLDGAGDGVVWRPLASESLEMDLVLIKLRTARPSPSAQRLWDLATAYVERPGPVA
jgi:DNA-binding transcriptional LysR family regulator